MPSEWTGNADVTTSKQQLTSLGCILEDLVDRLDLGVGRRVQNNDDGPDDAARAAEDAEPAELLVEEERREDGTGGRRASASRSTPAHLFANLPDNDTHRTQGGD